MLEKIPLKIIKANPFNARTDYGDDDIAEIGDINLSHTL
jgi:hypothetical protein